MNGFKAVVGAWLIVGTSSLSSCSSNNVESVARGRQPLVSANGTVTVSADESRTGWYPNQPGLNPVTVSGSTFGRLFKTPLPLSASEQVFAQPLVIDDNVFVVTGANNAYVLDAETGEIKASRSFGAAFSASDSQCGDINPTIGVTGTPVIDVASRTAYFFSKTYRAVRTGVLANDTLWLAHAVDVDTLAERPNFPVEITGQASNDATVVFDPAVQMQRPGLLLLGGVVYAGFGAHCDVGNYNGFVVGVSAAGQITSMFATEAGPQKAHGAGIWQSGSGLTSDGAGRIFFMTGNGYSNALVAPVPSNAPPATLDESCVRLDVQPDGSLRPMDFFAPYDAAFLDTADADFGAGGPVSLPTAFGTPQHPRLLLAGGKGTNLYLLDRDALGGFKQGVGQGDAVVSKLSVGSGMWSHPAIWSGDDGGWAYVTANQVPLQALQYSVRDDGVPVFSAVGASSDSLGFGSGSPIITSDGTTSGSGLVWVTTTSGAYGPGALRAYDAIPDAAGTLPLRFEDAYGRSAKFSIPGVGGGRIYVGTSDGFVVGYGAPKHTPVSGPTVDFGRVVVGASGTGSLVMTASQQTTITALASTSPAFVLGSPSLALPATLAVGDMLTVPVTFSPTAAQNYFAAVDVTSAEGPSAVSMKGIGVAAGPSLRVSPSAVSFGGVTLGASSTSNVVLTNNGSAPLTFTDVSLPIAPFSIVGAPTIGQVLNGGQSITVSITYAPVNSGTFVDHFNVSGGGKSLSVYLSGTSAYQGALTIAPLNLDFGLVPVGTRTVQSFGIADYGGAPITINKSKPPALGVFSALSQLDEGTVIPAGSALNESVVFAPKHAGAFTDHWTIGGSDAAGVQDVTFTGFASEGVGLLGTYYNGTNLSGAGIKHLDPQIAFSWGATAPLPGIVPSGYSVRWEGQIQAIHDETYTFYTKSTQGVRLSIGQSLIINNWTDHSDVQDFGQVSLQAGQKYPIVLEFYQHNQQAALELDWSSPSTPRQIVPSVALTPALDPATGACQFLALSSVAATASSSENNATLPPLAIDGDLTSRWSSAFSDPQWLAVDLGSVKRVRRVVLSWQDAFSKDYDIQVAEAAEGPWSTVYTQPNSDGDVDDIQLLNVNARYIRMYSRQRSSIFGVSLYEFQVYGDPSPICGPGPQCGNAVVDPGEGCDDGNSVNNDACSNGCIAATCGDGVQNQGEVSTDCGGPCTACVQASCSDGLQNQGETGVDCGGPCAACVGPTCTDHIQNQGETGVDCGGPCAACVVPTCTDQVQNQGETGIDCGGPCSACLTCTDGLQNQGETGVDCGGPCAAVCGSACQSNALTRATAVSSSNESTSVPATLAIDGSLTTRWSSVFSDPQWIYVDLGSIERVRRVVLRWETAASKDYDIQVSNVSAGPWTTIFTQPAGDGAVDDIPGLNANGRYVRMYSRQRATFFGNSLYEFEVYGDSNVACGAGPTCGNGVVDPGESCDDANTNNNDACSNTCVRATCTDTVQNQGETGVDCGGPCAACVVPTCTDHIQNQGETGVDCGGPCAACVVPTCTDHIQNQGETGVDCGGPCAACVVPTCTDQVQNQGETGIDCGGPCSACLTCTDGLQNQGETGVDCGGPCAAVCGSACQSNALTRATAVSSSNESTSVPATLAIDGSLTTRWSSVFSDPQWIYVDLGSIERVRRVVLRWETAASKDYDIQVSNVSAGPWTTIFTQPAGDGAVDDIPGLNANGRYVRMYSRQRATFFGNSLYEFEVYGDSNVACGAGPTCGNGVVDPGESCDDANTNNNDACSNTCVRATCTDTVQNQGETGVDCGGPCAACVVPTCTDHIQNQGETGVDCGGPCAACVVPTCTDHIQNQGETGVDCGGPCAACVVSTCTDHIQNQGETGVDCGGPCSACLTCSDGLQNQGETGVDCGGPCAACVVPTCTDHIQNQGETGVDCGGPCAACVVPTCTDQVQNQGETGIDCGGPCSACLTCTDGLQNQGETGVDCGGPCAAVCGSACQSNALTRATAVSSSNESTSVPATLAIDGSLTTRWSSVFSDPQWIYVDLGSIERVRRVVLRWETAASKDYDIQVSNVSAGPWTTIFTQPAGDGAVDDIPGLNANGRYVRMYSRQRATFFGNSLYEFEVYGDSNVACGAGPTCGNGVVDPGESCDDANTNNNDACSNTCVRATCTDTVQNQGETGVDCGGPCAACVVPTCTDHIQNQGETGVDCGGPCAACVVPTCTDHIQNQGETGVDCGGPCAACVVPTCTDQVQNQGETGIDCGGPCSACLTCSDGLQNQGEAGVDCGGPCPACGSICQSVAVSRASATASSSENTSYAAAFAIDGSLSTRWSSLFSDPQWIYVDLGSIHRVRRVVLRWEAAASKDYDIQVSNAADGPWTTIFTQPVGDGAVDDITGLNTNGRYVRVYSRQRTTIFGNSLFEFEVYGDGNLVCSP